MRHGWYCVVSIILETYLVQPSFLLRILSPGIGPLAVSWLLELLVTYQLSLCTPLRVVSKVGNAGGSLHSTFARVCRM